MDINDIPEGIHFAPVVMAHYEDGMLYVRTLPAVVRRPTGYFVGYWTMTYYRSSHTVTTRFIQDRPEPMDYDMAIAVMHQCGQEGMVNALTKIINEDDAWLPETAQAELCTFADSFFDGWENMPNVH